MQTKQEILDLLWNEPYKIGIWVGFKDLTELHNSWLKSFLFSKDDQTLLAHRGSYKTTVLSLFLALFIVIFPNKFVIFFRKTDTDVAEVIKQTANILHTGALNRIALILHGKEIAFIRETTAEIHTNLCTSIKGQSQLIGLGIGTSITGKHADVVVTDDIVNLKDRVSKKERETTKLRYQELENIKNRNGRFINTGTPWHKEDAISIMPNIKRYDCYQTGLISKEQIKAIRSKMTDSLFSANYELKHIADKNAMFKNPQYTSDTELIYNGIAHIDAAYDGEDKTAFTIIKKCKKDGKECYIGFGKLWDCHVDDCIDEIQVYMQLYRAGTVYCEKNGDKGYLKKELVNKDLHAKAYFESMNKHIKISTYLKAAWADIEWIDDTDPEYINQILDYSEFAEHDDAPDSAACLIRKYSTKSKYNSVEGGI